MAARAISSPETEIVRKSRTKNPFLQSPPAVKQPSQPFLSDIGSSGSGGDRVRIGLEQQNHGRFGSEIERRRRIFGSTSIGYSKSIFGGTSSITESHTRDININSSISIGTRGQTSASSRQISTSLSGWNSSKQERQPSSIATTSATTWTALSHAPDLQGVQALIPSVSSTGGGHHHRRTHRLVLTRVLPSNSVISHSSGSRPIGLSPLMASPAARAPHSPAVTSIANSGLSSILSNPHYNEPSTFARDSLGTALRSPPFPTTGSLGDSKQQGPAPSSNMEGFLTSPLVSRSQRRPSTLNLEQEKYAENGLEEPPSTTPKSEPSIQYYEYLRKGRDDSTILTLDPAMDSHGLEQNNEVDMDQDDIEQVVTFRSQRQCSPDPDSRHSPELQEDGDVQEDEDERLLAAAVMDPGMMAFARKSIMMNSRTEPRSIFQRFMSSTSKNPASMTSSAPKTTDDRSHDTLLRSKVQPASNHLAETALNLVDGSGGLQPGIESKIREEPGSIGSGTPKKTKPISSAASSVPPLWSTPKSKDICTKSNVTLQSSSSARIQPPPGLFSKVEPKPETKSTIPPTENKNNEDIQPPKPIIDFSDSSFTHRLPTWKTRRLGSGRQSYQSQSQPSQPQSALQGAYSRSGHYDHVQKDMSAADKNVFVSSSRSIIVSQVESVVRTSDVSESEREALEPMLEDTVDPVTTAGADLALTDAQDTPSTSIQDTQPSPPALTSPKRPVLFSLSDILRQDSESRAPYRLPNLTAQLDGSESVASASAHARKTTFGSGSSHGSRLFSPYSVPSIADRGVLRSQRTEATGTRSNVGAIVPSTPSFRARPFNPKVFTSAGDLGVPRVAKRPLTVPKSPVFSERRRAKDADRQQMGNPVTSAATRLKRMIGTAGQERDRERRK